MHCDGKMKERRTSYSLKLRLALLAMALVISCLVIGTWTTKSLPHPAEDKLTHRAHTDRPKMDARNDRGRPVTSIIGDGNRSRESLRDNVHINGFDFESMTSDGMQLGNIGMGAREASELEKILRTLQTEHISSETGRFHVIAQDQHSVTIGIPGSNRIRTTEEKLISDLKAISGQGYDILRAAIWPGIESMTADFGTRERILHVSALTDGKYRVQCLDFPVGEMPGVDQFKNEGFEELRRGAYSSWQRDYQILPDRLSHIFSKQ